MPDQTETSLLKEISKTLCAQGTDGMQVMMEALLNIVMRAERAEALGAEAYERTEQRQGYANGYKDKKLRTRVGLLQLKVPKVRGLKFYPSSLERGSRSERALKAAIAEMYLKGVSTRKVEAITRELCGLELSSSMVSRVTKELDTEFEAFRNRPLGSFPYLFLDATYLKVRNGGQVMDACCLLAYGVDSEGKRQIVGASMALSEASVHWSDFLASLQKRGVQDCQLIVSDSHMGLREARRAVFPSVPWQRCQFHMAQNAQAYAPKKSMRPEIAQDMRDIFNAPDRQLALELVKRASNKYAKSAPDFARWLEENIDEGLTVYDFPQQHRKRIRTTNGLERVNRELKRRTRVAVMFPNMASALRLVTGVLIEIHEEWLTGRGYLDMELSPPVKSKIQETAA